jgi:hypothetical protein
MRETKKAKESKETWTSGRQRQKVWASIGGWRQPNRMRFREIGRMVGDGADLGRVETLDSGGRSYIWWWVGEE